MFSIVDFDGDHYITVLDDTDGVSEVIDIFDLANHWNKVEHLFVSKCFSVEDDGYCLTAVYSTPLAPFEIMDESGIHYLSDIFYTLDIFDAYTLNDDIETYQGIVEIDNAFKPCSFANVMKYQFTRYYTYIPKLHHYIFHPNEIWKDIKSFNEPFKYLLYIYYSSLLAHKYNITDIKPFLKFDAINIYTKDAMYVATYEDNIIPIYYLVTSSYIGVVKPLIIESKYHRLKDYFPDTIRIALKHVGVTRPIKTDGNDLYYKGVGFKTLPELAKLEIMKNRG